jgi:LysM repeat protein
MGAERQSSLRVLAPASLAAFAVVLLIVVIASLAGDGGDGRQKPLEGTRTTKQESRSKSKGSTTKAPKVSAKPRFYIVKPGDNLAIIAGKEGVPLEELRALNPSLDPQSLVSGQRVKLPAPGG